MKKTVCVVGILYGETKKGRSYRLLFLEDAESSDSGNFEGRKVYTSFAPDDGVSYAVGQSVDIVCHKGEAIVIA